MPRRMALALLVTAMFLAGCRETGNGDLGKKYRNPLSPLELKLSRFIRVHSSKADPVETARTLAKAKRPKLMAAIACRESHFDSGAVGRDGELSMFQILKWPGGDPRDTARALAVAERHLEGKIADAGGDLWDGVRRYNGKGKAARRYREEVKALFRSIG